MSRRDRARPRAASGPAASDQAASASAISGPAISISAPAIWADEHLEVVDKPARLATVPERNRPDAPTVVTTVWERWLKDDPGAPKPFVVHRLDKETSGTLLLARTADAQAALSTQFEKHQVTKVYLAITRGAPAEPTQEVELDLAQKGSRSVVVAPGAGKRSRTRIEVVERFRDHALVRCELFTGRMHQIRVTLAHLGCPLAVDPRYGGGDALLLSSIKPGYRPARGREEAPLVDRLTLHAASLGWTHPETGDAVEVEAALPADLTRALRELRKHAGRGA